MESFLFLRDHRDAGLANRGFFYAVLTMADPEKQESLK